MSYRANSRYGYPPEYSRVNLGALGDVKITNISNGNLLLYDSTSKTWKNSSHEETLPPPLQSIASLSTTANQMLYTTASDVYDVTPITSAGRSFLTGATTAAQQSLLNLVPGTDVQSYSSVLTDLQNIGSGVQNRIAYSTGVTFDDTLLEPFARTEILAADSVATLQANTGFLTGPLSTVNRVVSVSGSNTLQETALEVDGSSNVTGINDLTLGNDLIVAGSMGGISSAERSQLANIDTTTISSTQWGYLGDMDQSVDSLSTPVFDGLSASSSRIMSVATPVADEDAANKGYVDAVASTGAPPLQNVQIATAAVLPNSPAYASPAETLTSTGGPGSLVVDTITLSVADRVLVKDQASATENGVYDVTDDGATPGPNWVLTRSSDFNQAAMSVIAGTSVFVQIEAGASNSGSSWALGATVNDVDPLTDDVTFLQIGGAVTFSAGNGIDGTVLPGGTIATDLTARLKYTTGAIDLETVTVPYGGTGVTTLGSGNVLVGQGTSPVQSTKPAPAGDFLGTSDAQTLTNKTITSNTNNVTASSIFSASGANTIDVAAAATPSPGYVLTATNGTTASWTEPVTFAPTRTLFVFTGAADASPNWSSVAGALADAVTLTPSATNPVYIMVFPGDYKETIPLTVPEYVYISTTMSAGRTVTIRPTAPAPAAAIISCGGNCGISGIKLDGADQSGGYAVIGFHSTGTGSVVSHLSFCTASNCTTANFRIEGDGTQFSNIAVLRACASSVTEPSPFVCEYGVDCIAGAVLDAITLSITGYFSAGGEITTGLRCTDDYSYTDVQNLQVYQTVTAFLVGGATNTSSFIYPSLRIVGGTTGLISSVSMQMAQRSYAEITSVFVDDDSAVFPDKLDIAIDNPALPSDPNVLIVTNSKFRSDAINIIQGAINNPASITGNGVSTTIARPQNIFLGAVGVGTIGAGNEFAAGEGNSSSNSLIVLQDDAGVFTNITATVNFLRDPVQDVDLRISGAVDLTSAPATIDGVFPVSGVSTVLVPDGSTANPGTTSVDNGVYVWNGAGNPFTRSPIFDTGSTYSVYISFILTQGSTYTGTQVTIDPASVPSDTVHVGTTAFAFLSCTANVFPTPLTNDDALYVGTALPVPFTGLRIALNTPLTTSSDTSREAVAWEYWNGSSWVDIPLMVRLANAPYTTKTTFTFGYGDSFTSETAYQYRFGDMSSWATTSVNGINTYWMRSRMVDASIVTQNPLLRNVRFNNNRMEINSNGFPEFFGDARSSGTIHVNGREFMDPGTGSGFTNPANQRIEPAASGGIVVSAQTQNTQFNDLANTAQTCSVFLPGSVDTSFPVTLKATYTVESDGAGDLVFGVNYVLVRAGNIIGTPSGTPDTTPQTTGDVPTAAPVSAGEVAAFSAELSISEMDPSQDQLWILLYRDGTSGADTKFGTIFVIGWSLSYREWSTGGYN